MRTPQTIFAIILWDNLVLGMLYRQYAFYADIYRPLLPPTRFNVASMPEDVSFVIYYFFMAATLNRGHGGNWTLAVLRRFTICPIVSGKDCSLTLIESLSSTNNCTDISSFISLTSLTTSIKKSLHAPSYFYTFVNGDYILFT